MTMKEKIKQSGYTHQYLAKRIGVSASYFSGYLNSGKRLSQQKEDKLKDIIKTALLQNVA